MIRFLITTVFAAYCFSCIAQGEVTEEFNKLFEKPDYRNATFGIQVIDAETGKELFSQNSEKLMIQIGRASCRERV